MAAVTVGRAKQRRDGLFDGRLTPPPPPLLIVSQPTAKPASPASPATKQPVFLWNTVQYKTAGATKLDKPTAKVFAFVKVRQTPTWLSVVLALSLLLFLFSAQEHFVIPTDIESNVKYGPLSGTSYEERVVAAYEWGQLTAATGHESSASVQMCRLCANKGSLRQSTQRVAAVTHNRVHPQVISLKAVPKASKVVARNPFQKTNHTHS